MVADLAHARLGHRRAQRRHHPLGRLGLGHVRSVHRPRTHHAPARGRASPRHDPGHGAGVHAQGGSRGASCLRRLRYVQHCSEPSAYV